jgi:hypothetical protein
MAAPQNAAKSKKSRKKPDFPVQTRLALPSSCRLDRSDHPKTMGACKFCQAVSHGQEELTFSLKDFNKLTSFREFR